MEKNFSDRIRGLRKQHKLSQEALADLIGTSQRQISYYESGENEPTVHVLVALADVLGTTADYIVGLDDNPNRLIRNQSDLTPYEKEAAEMLRQAHPDKRKEMLRVLKAMSDQAAGV